MALFSSIDIQITSFQSGFVEAVRLTSPEPATSLLITPFLVLLAAAISADVLRIKENASSRACD